MSVKRKLNGPCFAERAQIKPWLQGRLAPLGLAPVIERSDESKIVFKCKLTGQARGHNSSSNNHNHHNNNNHHPLRIRSNYSIRLRTWTLVLVPARHATAPRDLHLVATVAAALEDASRGETGSVSVSGAARDSPPARDSQHTHTHENRAAPPVLPTPPPARPLLPPLLPPLLSPHALHVTARLSPHYPHYPRHVLATPAPVVLPSLRFP